MATLTIRDLHESLKRGLRLRAASHNRSMEEEVRQILRAALQEPAAPTRDLGARIRSRFAALGDVQLPIAVREPIRHPRQDDETPASRRAGAHPARKSPRRLV